MPDTAEPITAGAQLLSPSALLSLPALLWLSDPPRPPGEPPEPEPDPDAPPPVEEPPQPIPIPRDRPPPPLHVGPA